MTYRINGFDQIKAFYSWVFSNADKNVKPQHISLYLFLINQNNRNNWIEWFKCPFDLAMTGACIGSKKTYYSCLEDLQTWKFIKYKKGTNNWKAPLIKLEVLKCTATVPQSEPQSEPQCVPQSEPLPIHIYKLITNNLKHIIERYSEFEKLVNEFSKGNKLPTLQDRKDAFKKDIRIEAKGEYKDEMLFAFFNYWSEHNTNGKKMKYEMQKVFNISARLKTWCSKEFNNKPQSIPVTQKKRETSY